MGLFVILALVSLFVCVCFFLVLVFSLFVVCLFGLLVFGGVEIEKKI